MLIMPTAVLAQDKKAESDALVKQGTVLHDAQKYDEAIAKYNEALKIAPDNLTAMYEKGFTLYASGKADDALVILEKLSAIDKSPRTYALLGNIYDDRKVYDKSVDYYTKGIALAPKDGNLWYNLGVSYIMQQKFAQAQAAAEESIKINPRHVGSHKIYAVATYAQGKHAMSLLAWCNYLMFFPKVPEQVEGDKYINNILHFSLKGTNDIVLQKGDDQSQLQQMTIAMAMTSISPLLTSPNKLDSLSVQLASAFRLINASKDKFNSPFFSKYFANFFGALEKTQYINLFTHYIFISASPTENIAWLKARPDEVKAFNEWLVSIKRETE